MALFFGILFNAAAVGLNLWVGATFGFSVLTYVGIAVNSACMLWLLALALD